MSTVSGYGRRLCLVGVAIATAVPATAEAEVDYVVHISVDGLRPDAITNQSAALLPNFYRLRGEGAFTDNARTDFDYTTTLQNHTGMLTGRHVLGTGGHLYLDNSDPPPGQTLHTVQGAYVASVFDVVHDHGLRTGLFATKTKFSVYAQSYGPDATPLHGGAPDVTGLDNGRNKIDTFRYESASPAMVNAWAAGMSGCSPYTYSFLHFHDTDSAGHAYTWDVLDPNSAYLAAARDVDARLGEVFATIDGNPALAGHTTIILTADHGGTQGTLDHTNAAEPQDYTIPFYVWGAGVTSGDLYSLSGGTRLDPGTGRPGYDMLLQPIRNADSGNLALSLLGLGAIPGSTVSTPLALVVPEPAFLFPAALLAVAGFGRRRVRRV